MARPAAPADGAALNPRVRLRPAPHPVEGLGDGHCRAHAVPRGLPRGDRDVAAAMLIGRKVVIRPKRHDDWQVGLNLFGLCVGRPSLMKSPAIQEALSYLTRFEIEARKRHADDVAAQEAHKALAEATRKVMASRLRKAISRGEDREDLAAQLARDDDGAPVRQRFLVTNTTVEKLGVILNENPNGVLIYCDEVVGWFDG